MTARKLTVVMALMVLVLPGLAQQTQKQRAKEQEQQQKKRQKAMEEAQKQQKKRLKQQQRKTKKDFIENRALTTFYLQDPVDGMCLGPSGQFGACDEFSLFVYAARRDGKQHSLTALLAPAGTANCVARESGSWIPGLGGSGHVIGARCGAAGAKAWELVQQGKHFVATENNGKNCLLREAALGGYGTRAGAGAAPGGSSGALTAHNAASMPACRGGKSTPLDIIEVGVHDTGFLLMTSDRQCFDGSSFRTCNERDAGQLWGVAVRFDGKGNAQRSLHLFHQPELCLYTDGRRPKVDRCDKRGSRARGWGLLHGALSHGASGGVLGGLFGAGARSCVVRAVDGSAFLAPCKLGRFEPLVIDIPGNMDTGSDEIKKLVNQEFERDRFTRENEARTQQMRSRSR